MFPLVVVVVVVTIRGCCTRLALRSYKFLILILILPCYHLIVHFKLRQGNVLEIMQRLESYRTLYALLYA